MKPDLYRILTALEAALPYLPEPCDARYAAEDAIADLRHALGKPALPVNLEPTVATAEAAA